MNLLRVLSLFSLLVASLVTSPARAAERAELEAQWVRAEKATAPAPETDVFTRLDGLFGQVVVGPLATVMFFDVLFWDNELELGRGIGRVEVPKGLEGGEPRLLEVTSFKAGEGYGRQEIRKVTTPLRAILPEPTSRRVGPLNVTLQTEETPDGPVVMARVPVQNADLAALGVQPWDAAGPELPVVQVMVPALGFQVPVDRQTLKVQPASGVAPEALVPVKTGARVYDPVTAKRYQVTAGEAGAWFLMDDEIVWSHERLPNPSQVSMPIVVLWLVLGAMFFTVRMAFINLRAFGHALAVVSGLTAGPP